MTQKTKQVKVRLHGEAVVFYTKDAILEIPAEADESSLESLLCDDVVNLVENDWVEEDYCPFEQVQPVETAQVLGIADANDKDLTVIKLFQNAEGKWSPMSTLVSATISE